MWYVIPHNKSIAEHLAQSQSGFNNFGEAREKADFLRAETGNHYHVIKIQTVWTTKTIEEAMKEG